MEYITGTIVTLSSGEGKARLVKRVLDGKGEPITYPTKGEHQLAQWEVELLDVGKDYNGKYAVVSRPVVEKGVPNTNRPPSYVSDLCRSLLADDEPKPTYTPKPRAVKAELTEISSEIIEDAVKVTAKTRQKPKKRGRKAKGASNGVTRPVGRPVVPMNELKARNTLRAYKQGKRKADDQLKEAITFISSQEWGAKYLKKHLLQPLEI